MGAEHHYLLTGADGRLHASLIKGAWGGHRAGKIYGRLDCPAALRAIARGGYVKNRVFFLDEATAVLAGYRPCATCCRDRYREWKATTATPTLETGGPSGTLRLRRQRLPAPS